MTKIFLLTAPFDEKAKTGDGQYADSLVEGFKQSYKGIPCTWLKQAKGNYSIPQPIGATSIPADTIPSAMVLQPVANENTKLSGYKLSTEHASAVEAQKVNTQTVTPRTPKVILKSDDSLHSLTIMDIYTKKPIVLDEAKVDEIIVALKAKKTHMDQALLDNAKIISIKSQKSRLKALVEAYKANNKNIQTYCSLNEFLEAHECKKVNKTDFNDRQKRALTSFETLKGHFTGKAKLKALEKFSDDLTGIKKYPYDFHSNNLTYDLEADRAFRAYYNYDGLKSSLDQIITHLQIRKDVELRYENSFRALNEPYVGSREQELKDKNYLITKIYTDGEYDKTYDLETFKKALFDTTPTDYIDDAIDSYKKVSALLTDTKSLIENKDKRAEFIENMQTIMARKEEPFLSTNKSLEGFYGKRKLSASEGFHLAYAANRRDPLKPIVIADIIASMKPIDEDTHLDIHIRPPDCGVFITPEDIKRFKAEGIKVNLTIHEYKQNYTRRYLQQYTHDLMREADTVQFFNAEDRNNAMIAAHYGDCDKRNTTERSGVKKKEREVGAEVELDKYPVEVYNLKRKSGLTVASQKLSTTPANPLDVIAKPPNILSFGTIRPGKGFEEALTLAKLVKKDAKSIGEKIGKKRIPIVKLAGDPQDYDLMQNIVVERFGKDAVSTYQSVKEQAYNSEFTDEERRNYWKKLVDDLNIKVEEGAELNNPFIEIHPWCESGKLLSLKKSCKYVCRMDDMGMRNNGSAIISVLDVGVVYTKFGSVTDKIFTEGGTYGNAVDIGKYRFGKFSLLKSEEDHLKLHGDRVPLPKWLKGNPDSAYKRKPESRDPQDILNSIIAREEDQLQYLSDEDVVESHNYKTVVEAQKLLTERFTLRNAVESLLKNVGLGHMVTKEIKDPVLLVDPVEAQEKNVKESSIQAPLQILSVGKSSEVGLFSHNSEERLKVGQINNKMDNIVTINV